MSSNGWILNKELPAYYGFFAELNPRENPITTLAAAKGLRIVDNQVYAQTFHTIANSSSANLKPDNASVTLGSTNFSTGSNTVQVWFEGGAETWARKGVQELGRVLGYKNPSNPSIEPIAKDRAVAEGISRIKSELEYIAREGAFAIPHAGTTSGTTGTWEQRGYRYGDGLTIGTSVGGVAGTGTLGTLGTLTFDLVLDTLQDIWDKGNWRDGNLLAVCNSTVKRQLTDIFKTEYDFGKNGAMVTESGVNLLRWVTDFGNVDILLTHNFPGNDLYFLNMDHMHMVARPVPGMPQGGVLFEKDLPQTTAGDMTGVYAEMGMDYTSGSYHGRIFGIGSTVIGGQAVS